MRSFNENYTMPKTYSLGNLFENKLKQKLFNCRIIFFFSNVNQSNFNNMYNK